MLWRFRKYYVFEFSVNENGTTSTNTILVEMLKEKRRVRHLLLRVIFGFIALLFSQTKRKHCWTWPVFHNFKLRFNPCFLWNKTYTRGFRIYEKLLADDYISSKNGFFLLHLVYRYIFDRMCFIKIMFLYFFFFSVKPQPLFNFVQ